MRRRGEPLLRPNRGDQERHDRGEGSRSDGADGAVHRFLHSSEKSRGGGNTGAAGAEAGVSPITEIGGDRRRRHHTASMSTPMYWRTIPSPLTSSRDDSRTRARTGPPAPVMASARAGPVAWPSRRTAPTPSSAARMRGPRGARRLATSARTSAAARWRAPARPRRLRRVLRGRLRARGLRHPRLLRGEQHLWRSGGALPDERYVRLGRLLWWRAPPGLLRQPPAVRQQSVRQLGANCWHSRFTG